MAYNIGIRECRKCDNNIRCEECVFPAMANRRAEEIAELRKNCWIAEQTIKAQTELVRKQKAEIAELKKHPHCPSCVDFCLYSENYEKHDKAVRAEAIREFAKTYKDHVENYTGMFTDEGFCVSLVAMLNAVDFIEEKLLKEGEK